MPEPYSKPTRAALRSFGFMFGCVLAALFGVLVPLIRHGFAPGLPFVSGNWPAWPWIAAATIGAWALLHPASLVWLHRPWMRFAHVAGWVNTRLIMLLLFYVMILPIGLLLRLFGKDSMRRKWDADARSYRVKADARDSDHMDKPY